MSDFKPWRRKIGLVTLFLACVCMAGWVRSFASTNDHFTIWKNHSVYSHDGWVSWNSRYTEPLTQDSDVDHLALQVAGNPRLVRAIVPKVKSRWEYGGFVATDTVINGQGTKQYWITWWYLILPLTLLSAYLLLSKPRSAVKVSR